MAPPPLRRMKRASSVADANSPAPARTAMATAETPRMPPLKDAVFTPKTPFRRVNDGRITKSQKQGLLDNLEVELNERSRKLRSQVNQQSRALKQRIEMRITRIPKKLWKVTMAEMLAQAEGRDVANPMVASISAKEFVEEVRSLSRGAPEKERLIVSKRSPSKPAVSPARERMPPPPLPALVSSNNPLSTKPNLQPMQPSLSSPPRSSSPQRSPTRQGSPAKASSKGPTRARKAAAPTNASNSRPTSRVSTRSSIETAGTQASGMRGTKSSKAKAAAAIAAPEAKGLKRGGGGNTGSNGSLKENRVAGVKTETTGKVATGRVLRSRK
ncbi:hypothetical protein BZA05DRAFT_470524 [Tricharina praecox]|uniref:uncharacterized protein n=1 Tax=Tricharina praecox TaxID=43433 RepID=UPI00221E8D81|nr:uncharacterized protein BZA05DRAFT_470524 [Tricharina praecox]KAI5857644.1 hypothetical protein BZA05DRAFT_470524 [Tricharina praecox]